MLGDARAKPRTVFQVRLGESAGRGSINGGKRAETTRGDNERDSHDGPGCASGSHIDAGIEGLLMLDIVRHHGSSRSDGKPRETLPDVLFVSQKSVCYRGMRDDKAKAFPVFA